MVKLKDKVWRAFSEYIRLKECIETTGTTTHGICCTCNKTVDYSQLDAGHFISRRHTVLLFSEANVHIQCRYCNRFNQGMGAEYFIYMENRYGREEVEKLLVVKHMSKKYKDYELESMRRYYRDEIKKLKR